MACDHCEELKEEIRFLQRELSLRGAEESINRFVIEWGLTRKEAEILAALNRRPGSVIPREMLWDTLYLNGDYEPAVKIIDVFMSKLRAKLAPEFILSVWGTGYLLSEAGVKACAEVLASEPKAPAEIRRMIVTPPRRQTHTFRLTVLRLLASGPKNREEIQGVLPRQAQYQANSMAATFVRDGRATKIPGNGPGQLSRWCLTKAGFDYLARMDPDRSEAA